MLQLHRRTLAALAVSTLAGPAIVSRARARDAGPMVQLAVGRFSRLPGASCLIVADGKDPWQIGQNAGERRFVGSALKTFILLAPCATSRTAGSPWTSNWRSTTRDRTLNSPAFLNLTGTTQATSVLEAMITHSDNTATDIAMAAVGADRVRALIAEAGLKQHPDRRFDAQDVLLSRRPAGRPGCRLAQGEGSRRATHPTPPPGAQRRHDDGEHGRRHGEAGTGGPCAPTISGKPNTRVEFRRIQAMATALWQVVPAGIVAYGKGGSIDWGNFHCLCLPGTMVVGATPVTFCFTINWTGPDEGVATLFKEYVSAVAYALEETVKAVG